MPRESGPGSRAGQDIGARTSGAGHRGDQDIGDQDIGGHVHTVGLPGGEVMEVVRDLSEPSRGCQPLISRAHRPVPRGLVLTNQH